MRNYPTTHLRLKTQIKIKKQLFITVQNFAVTAKGLVTIFDYHSSTLINH